MKLCNPVLILFYISRERVRSQDEGFTLTTLEKVDPELHNLRYKDSLYTSGVRKPSSQNP